MVLVLFDLPNDGKSEGPDSSKCDIPRLAASIPLESSLEITSLRKDHQEGIVGLPVMWMELRQNRFYLGRSLEDIPLLDGLHVWVWIVREVHSPLGLRLDYFLFRSRM